MSTTHASLHADHQLDQLAGQFEHWRQTRSHPSERIPQHLWDQAAALARVLPHSRVAQHLRLSPSDLNKHMATRPDAAPATPRTAPPFVEVPSLPACLPAPAAIEIDLERPDGARLQPALPRVHGTRGHLGTGLFGGRAMIQLTPQSRIFLATEPVDFRKGIDGLAAVCRQRLGDNPLEGAVYVFRNRSGTSLKLLLYGGQGYWMCMKRLSTGRFSWWPQSADARVPLSARELVILLWNGLPDRAQMAKDWRRVA